jgi:hypothetical protein
MSSADIFLAILGGILALLSGILALRNCIIDVKGRDNSFVMGRWRSNQNPGIHLAFILPQQHKIGLMGTIGYDYYNGFSIHECIS